MANANITTSENTQPLADDRCGYGERDSSLILNKKCDTRAQEKDKEKGKERRRSHSYLSIDVLRKMISELLHNNKISLSRLKLANALDIDIEDLDKLMSQKRVSTELMTKINLPLIELYCGTRSENR